MGHETLIDLCKTTLLTALMICAPALLVGMAVGLLVSFFQTVTSLQEQTLTIVPEDKKIIHGMTDAALLPCRMVNPPAGS